jgi:dolichol-phosphate hexosyltransferase
MRKTLSVIIPCLNEQEAIPSVMSTVSQVREHFLNDLKFHDVQVIVVDDASRDNSVELLKTFSFVELLRHPKTKGYGASLKTGFAKARGQWICFFDMDNSYPADRIPSMLELLVKHDLDLVLAKRAFVSDGMSFTRGFGNWMFSAMTRAFFKAPLNDVCSGFRIFRRELLPEVLSISNSTLAYSLEMSIRFSRLGLRTQEFEIDYFPRKGASKLSVWKDGWLFLSLILRKAYKRESEIDRNSSYVQRSAKVLEAGPEIH